MHKPVPNDISDSPIFRFGTPHIECGWLEVPVCFGNAVHQCDVSFLCEPYRDMLEAVLGLADEWDQNTSVTVDWIGEPSGHCWTLTRIGEQCIKVKLVDKADFSPSANADERIVFDLGLAWGRFAGQVFELGRQILSLYGLTGYRKAWMEHDFPYTEWRELGDGLGIIPVPDEKNTLANDIFCLQTLLGTPAGFHDAKMREKRSERIARHRRKTATAWSPEKLDDLPPVHIGTGVIRRIERHRNHLFPEAAFGFLLGSTDQKYIYAALPCSEAERHQDRGASKSFGALHGDPYPPATVGQAYELAARRGLAIVGLYHTVSYAVADTPNPLHSVPAPFLDGLVLLFPQASRQNDWWTELFRRSSRFTWGSQPCRVERFRDPEMRLNPKRIHTDWLQITGWRPAPKEKQLPSPPVDRATYPVLRRAAVSLPPPPEPWDARRLPVAIDEAADSMLERLRDAIGTEKTVDLVYQGGSRQGTRRTVRPLELFTVPGNPDIYVEVLDLDVDDKRIYRFDRIEKESAGTSSAMRKTRANEG